MVKKISLFLLIFTCFLHSGFAGRDESSAQAPDLQGMVFVKGGCYQMGDMFGDVVSAEKPVHEVCLDDFYLDKYEVTQQAYQKATGKKPAKFNGCDDCPVEQVSWYDADSYCKKVGQRLPTEAEWEYAARSGGKKEKFAGTDANLGDYAWYEVNSEGKTHPVGSKKPNGLGIYDMSGNVWEWCSDWYGGTYYSQSPKNNPRGPDSGTTRVFRGGSWYVVEYSTRSASRNKLLPSIWNFNMGFRCAKTK